MVKLELLNLEGMKMVLQLRDGLIGSFVAALGNKEKLEMPDFLDAYAQVHEATLEVSKRRTWFLWFYACIGVVLLSASIMGLLFGSGGGALLKLYWALGWAFLGFSAIVRKVRKHWPDPLPSYWSVYPWVVAGSGALVWGLCAMFAAHQPVGVFLALTAGPAFVLGYCVDRIIR